jgi:hypothetical protein
VEEEHRQSGRRTSWRAPGLKELLGQTVRASEGTVRSLLFILRNLALDVL